MKKNAGKGMRPVMGYNPNNWYKNFDQIKWSKTPNKRKNICQMKRP